MNGEKHLFQASEAEKRLDNTTAVFEFNKAKNTFLSTDNYAIPLDWHIGRIRYNEGNFAEALRYLHDAYKLNPYSVVVNNDLGSTYLKNGRADDGISHYKQALAISSQYEDARINLAAAYFNIREYETAFQTLERFNGNSENNNHNAILTPIIEKKLNASLVRLNNTALNDYLKSKIKTEEDLLSLYFEYKKNNLTFDKYILSLINSK